MIVLDASGSMRELIEGRPKIDIAKEVIRDLLEDVDPELHLGLYAYGHRRKKDCRDIELLIPPKPLDKPRFLRRVNSLDAKGMTPLTAAVVAAAKTLKYEREKGNVILVTDGIETCRRDSCDVAKILAKRSLDLKVHVVAFDLSAEQVKTVRCFSDETDGHLLEAQDASTLNDALEIAIEESSQENDEPIDLNPATLNAPPDVPAGSEFEVEWTGPDNAGDIILITGRETAPSVHGNYAYAYRGSPSKLRAQVTPGDYEIRYLTRKNQILGQRDITVSKVTASLHAAEQAATGSTIPVRWKGPANRGDYITIVPRGAGVKEYSGYKYVRQDVDEVMIPGPTEPGEFEIRYITGREASILAATQIKIVKATATLKAPNEVMAGAPFDVTWTGPANKSEFITIVPAGAPASAYSNYKYVASKQNPITLDALQEIGPAEVRYIGRGKKIVASHPLNIVAAKVSFSAPTEVMAGAPVLVQWTGPGGSRDQVTVVMKEAPAKTQGDAKYVKRGSELTITAPLTSGMGEIRYLGRGRVVLHRQDISIAKPTAKLSVDDNSLQSKTILVDWEGPGHPRDRIMIVPAGSSDKMKGAFTYAGNQSPAKLRRPKSPGRYEIRYVTNRERRILARIPINVSE